MIALIWAVIGIGLVGALLYGGISYFQGTAPERLRIKEAMIAEVEAEAAAYQAFISANGIAPTSFTTQIVGYYLPERKLPISGMTWSDGVDATYGNYICLTGSVSSVGCKGLEDVGTAATVNATTPFPTNAYVLNFTSCTTRTAVTCASNSTWPTTAYVTYWLRGSA